MTQKQTKFAQNRRPKSLKQGVEEYGGEFRRRALESLDDFNRMAEESSRARLISQLVSQPGDRREFASYYLAPTWTTEPSYSVSSHTKKNCTKKITPVIPTYPSMLQSLRWCPNVSTSDDEVTASDERSFNCKCANCTTKKCYTKMYPNSMKSVVFKDNIMTFCDQYTMTPKLRDASCECTTRASSTSDVAVSMSDVAVRDEECCAPVYTSQTCSPIPILKRSCRDFGLSPPCKDHMEDFENEVARDIDVIQQKPKRVRSIKSFFKLRSRQCDDVVCPRINIYNEGISDSIANHLPVSPQAMQSPRNMKRERSRLAVKIPSYTDTEVYIPYSHRSDSKYHNTCKMSTARDYHEIDSDDGKVLVTRPVARIPGTFYRPTSIKLPKKVLMSERDIEPHLYKAKPKKPSKSR